MCEQTYKYLDAPTKTYGGPPGDYVVPAFSPSNATAEYKIVSVSSSGVNPGIVVVSGVSKPIGGAIDQTGGTIYNGENSDTSIAGHVIPIGPNAFIPVDGPWEEIAGLDKKLFIRIDGVVAAFVSIKRRIKILERVPGPFTTVNPYEQRMTDHESKLAYNAAREQAIREQVLQKEGIQEEYGNRPGPAGTIVQPAPGARTPGDVVAWLKGEK